MAGLQLLPIGGIGEIRPGDALGPMIVDAANAQDSPLLDHDCLVVTQKIVSKAEDRLVPLDHADFAARAELIASETVRSCVAARSW